MVRIQNLWSASAEQFDQSLGLPSNNLMLSGPAQVSVLADNLHVEGRMQLLLGLAGSVRIDSAVLEDIWSEVR